MDFIDIAPASRHTPVMRITSVGLGVGCGFNAHRHADAGECELHYFIGGAGDFITGGRRLEVRPGVLVFSRPDERHAARSHGPDLSFYWVRFTADGDAELLGAVRRALPDGPRRDIGGEAAAEFEAIRRAFDDGAPDLRRSAEHRLLSMLFDLAGRRRRPRSARAREYADQAIGIMRASLSARLDLGELAGRLGIDRSYFVRVFTAATGRPPMRYFADLKVDSARFALTHSDRPVREIALELGIEDEFYFSRLFKARVGVSPLAFRRQGGA
jgi:AraC-like DNA-binding protein/quercetin dioxygenase-like cupin family protein